MPLLSQSTPNHFDALANRVSNSSLILLAK